MKNLIKFELKKIMINRLSMISIIAVILISLILSFSTVNNMYAFDNINTEGHGKAAIEIDKAIAAKYEGILTTEKVQQIMIDFKPNHNLNNMNAKYIYQNAIQSAAFARFSDMKGNWNNQSVAEVFGDEEITIGYVNGWLNTSQNMAKIFLFLSLAIILIIAPVFSSEYSGVDNIILTSKYGKTKCITAKILASLISTLLITLVIVILNGIFALAIYGTDGLNCSILFAPIDFVEGYIPFNITCKTVLKYQILLAFTSALSITSITLIISVISKNQMITFSTSAAVYILPIMLPITELSPLYKLNVLMPIYNSQYISVMSIEQMQNGISYAIWTLPLAIILLASATIVSHKVFSKHQVS